MRTPAKTFQDLIVWQKAHGFVLQTYTVTRGFPKEEIYGLTSQFRRAAVSIPANIAEGFRKQSSVDKARILNISEGSLEECRYYLILRTISDIWTSRCIGNRVKKLADFSTATVLPSFVLTPNS